MQMMNFIHLILHVIKCFRKRSSNLFRNFIAKNKLEMEEVFSYELLCNEVLHERLYTISERKSFPCHFFAIRHLKNIDKQK